MDVPKQGNICSVKVIGYEKLEGFWRRHADAKSALSRWYTITSQADWRNLADTRLTFPSADPVGACTVFNIGGNKYRLISRINYGERAVNVKHVLTHKEYDSGAWKSDC